LTSNAFTVTAGSHTLLFRGLNPNGGDNTAFFDLVTVNVVTGSPSGAPSTGATNALTVRPSSITPLNGTPVLAGVKPVVLASAPSTQTTPPVTSKAALLTPVIPAANHLTSGAPTSLGQAQGTSDRQNSGNALEKKLVTAHAIHTAGLFEALDLLNA
jgi:hypothetical protein